MGKVAGTPKLAALCAFPALRMPVTAHGSRSIQGSQRNDRL